MKRRDGAVVALALVAFVSLGLPDGLLGVAWPSIRAQFGLPLDALGMFLVFSTAGYMSSSLFSGALVRRLGVGSLLAASCAATAVALAAYSLAPSWWFFVSLALVGGFGAGAIDAGLNSYVDRHHSQRLMQWLHASFGVGTTLGPIIMTVGLQVSDRWQPGYQVVAGAQLLLATAFLITRRLWERSDSPAGDSGASQRENPEPTPGHGTEAGVWQSLRNPRSLLGMLLFFTYTGVELGVGLWAYTFLTEARGVSTAVAGVVTAGYWASFTVGRIIAGFFGSRVRPVRLVTAGIGLAAAGVGLVWMDAGAAVSVVGIALVGLVIAPIFPALVSDTRNRVESEHLSNTIGMQIAGAGLGGAVLPAVAGLTAEAYGLEVIPPYLVCVIGLLLLLFAVAHLVRPEPHRYNAH